MVASLFMFNNLICKKISFLDLITCTKQMLFSLTMSQTADDDNNDQNEKEEDSQYNGCYFSGGKPWSRCWGSSVSSIAYQKMTTM